MAATNEVVMAKFNILKIWKNEGHKIVFWPGRAKFPHKGHISFLKALHDKGFKILIGNGSCYSIDPRNPVHAFQIQVMLAQSLFKMGMTDKDFVFVPIPDFENDSDWAQYIAEIPNFNCVSHVATDNPEVVTAIASLIDDSNLKILRREDVIEELVDINATKLREALLRNDWQTWYKYAASGTIDFLLHVGDLSQIRNAIMGNEKNFNPGRQTVDIFVFVFDGFRWHVVLGNRKDDKGDFPGCLACPGGGIDPYEDPLFAGVRELGEETGLKAIIMAPYTLPAGIVLEGKMGAAHFVKMYASRDRHLAGASGGSSLCFMTVFDGTKNELDSFLTSESDLVNVRTVRVEDALNHGLAYQQTEMLRDSYRMLERIRGE